MGDSKQICRLCLDIVPNSEAIKETEIEILEILLINIDLHISDSAVACNRCLLELHYCHDFKTNCLYTDNYISSFFVKANIRVDIKKVFKSQIKNGANINLENVNICRLCMSLIEENKAVDYSNDLKDVIGNCLPEVDLSTVHEPLFCEVCLSRMKRLYKFMKTCHEVEQKIQNYYQDAVGHSISNKVFLHDLLYFENYRTASKPIKEEYSDLDVEAKRPTNEDIISNECEGVHIKDELDNEVDASGDCNSSWDGSSTRKRQTRQSASNTDMGFISKQICRLCLEAVPNRDSEAIDGTKKGILKVLLINIDFDICNEAVACKTCLVKVQDCFDFKSNCLYVDDYNGTFLGQVVQERVTSNEDMRVENVQTCQLCMSSIEDGADNWTTDSKDTVSVNIMIGKCLPEVTLNAVNAPLLCKLCVSNMNKYDEFMEICHQAEQRIKSYRDVAVGLGVTVVLKDLLEYESRHTFSAPIFNATKEECLDAESDVNVTSCPEKEDIASIKLEVVHIKEESEDVEEVGESCPSGTYNTSGKSSSLKRERQIKKAASKGRKHLSSEARTARHKGKVFRCKDCSFKTDKNYALTQHMIRHQDKSEVEMHKCANCDFETRYKRSMVPHMLKHRNPAAAEEFKCEKCPYKTADKSYLRKHHQTHKDNSEVEMHKCENCEFETRYKKSMIQHMVKHRDPGPEREFKCDICPYETVFKAYLHRHNQRHKLQSKMEMLKCGKCEFETRYKSRLNWHMMSHRDPKPEIPLKCEKCPYKTGDKSNLRKHSLIHKNKSEVEMYKCENCDFETRHKGSMMKHISKYHDPNAERKFKCDKCPFETDFKSYLGRHILKHKDKSEVEMLKCENCEFESMYKTSMIKHVAKHRDSRAQRKVKCDKRSYETDFKSSQRTHNLRHMDKSEVETYKCDNCEYETRRKSNMIMHMVKHRDPEAERKFKCDKCPYETDFMFSLRRHNVKHKDTS